MYVATNEKLQIFLSCNLSFSHFSFWPSCKEKIQYCTVLLFANPDFLNF
jgi:hypothetical protein